MPEKNFTGIILVNNSSSTVVLSGLTNDSMHLLRTDTGGTDGEVYFNGKRYFTMETISPHLLKNNTSAPLPSAQTEIVFDNIGWRGVVISLTVVGDSVGPQLPPVTVTAKYDGSEVAYTCSPNKVNRIDIPPYVDYSLEFGNKTGFITPDPVSGKGGRGLSTSITAVYRSESDLSLISPLDGSIIGTRETANCYIIREPGIYDIPLVYGCGIVDDRSNRECLEYNPTYSGTTQPFYNAFDNGITNVLITEDTQIMEFTGEVVLNDSEDFIIDNEDITFLDKPIILDETSIGVKHMRFKCKRIPPLGANATIAIRDTITKEIIWSWHIWGFPHDIILHDRVSGQDIHYQEMDVNLGWTYLDNTLTKGFAPYYQWGRKDPMLRYGGVPRHGTSYVIAKDAALGVSDSIKHPNTFFVGNSWWTDVNGDPQLFYNYWDFVRTDASQTVGVTNKTIYDPCPRGFTVPSFDFFDTFDIEEGMKFDDGYTFGDRYYQALGYLSFNDGKPANVYTNGYYWTTWSAGSSCAGKALKLYDGGVQIGATGNNGFATQIVPVRVKL